MRVLTGEVHIYNNEVTAPIEGRPNVHIVVGPDRNSKGLVVSLVKLKENRHGPYLERTELRRMGVHSTPLQGMRARVLELRRRRHI